MQSVAGQSRQHASKFKKRFLFIVLVLIAATLAAYLVLSGSRLTVREVPMKLGGEELDYSNLRWISKDKFVFGTDYSVSEYDLQSKTLKTFSIEGKVKPPPLPRGSVTYRGGMMISSSARFFTYPGSTPNPNFSPDGKRFVEVGFDPPKLAPGAKPKTTWLMPVLNILERQGSEYRKVKTSKSDLQFVAWKDNETLLVMSRPIQRSTKERGKPYAFAGLYEWNWKTGATTLVGEPDQWFLPRYTSRGTLVHDTGAEVVEYSIKPFKQIRRSKLPMSKTPVTVHGGSPAVTHLLSARSAVRFRIVTTSLSRGPQLVIESSSSVSPDGRSVSHLEVEKRPSILRKFFAKVSSSDYSDEVYVLRVTDLATNTSKEVMTFPKKPKDSGTFIKWTETAGIEVVVVGSRHYLVDLPNTQHAND